MKVPSEFDDIRPYEPEEVQQVIHELIEDRQLNKVIQTQIPFIPKGLRQGIMRLACMGIKTTQDFQVRFMKPIMKYIIWRSTSKCTFDGHPLPDKEGRYTFISNHRDIVLDSAILDVHLFDKEYDRTVEIGIGDNLLIYPWIKKLVRLNKCFTVHRGLSPRELLQSSELMSRYIHFAVNEKKENIWLAQREGRAKDSNDRTQESVLKMLVMGGEGTLVERMKHLHIVPLTISYEYDPCDYLKAKEFQMKRDNPNFKKSTQDDLDNMSKGIDDQKGHVHYECAPCIDTWLDEFKEVSRNEFFEKVAQRMDREIHKGYKIYPGNYVAAHLLRGGYEDKFTEKDKQKFEKYLQRQLDKIEMENKDETYLRDMMLTMYANPLFNQESALKE